MIKAAAKGAPVIAIGVALQTSAMSVMGFADKNIKTPADIKGKIVASRRRFDVADLAAVPQEDQYREGDFKQVAGDAQTKLNAVINGQADLLLGYVMDQAIKLQDATKKQVYPIRFADYGVNLVSSASSSTRKRSPRIRTWSSASCARRRNRSRKRPRIRKLRSMRC
jgi:NitT/TauT family transport system substrate-binding protein